MDSMPTLAGKLYRAVKNHKRRKIVAKKLGLEIKDRFYYPARTHNSKRTYSVVAPVYRVEKYLDTMLASLLRQSLDFRKHIQVILVDDGSDDGSTAICREWAERFPYNITHLRKENGGLSSARNAGLPYATGDWVGFIDPDDLVDKDYFLSVDRALDVEDDTDNLHLVSCKLIFFYEDEFKLADSHPQRYRFQNGHRKVVFDDNCDDIQLSAARALFNRRKLAETNLLFEDVRPNAEDLHLIARYFLAMEMPTVLFVPEAKYWYRKRSDKTSLLDAKWIHPGTYSQIPEDVYLDLLTRQIGGKERPPRWLQRTVLYDVAWHFKQLVNKHRNADRVPPELKPRYVELLHDILSRIDPEIILSFELAGVNDDHRFAMLALGHPEVEQASEVKIFKIDTSSNQFCVRYHYTGSQPDFQVMAGTTTVTPTVDKVHTQRFLGETLSRAYVAWFPWPGNGVLRFSLNGKLVERPVAKCSKKPTIERLTTAHVKNPGRLRKPVKIRRYLAQHPVYTRRFRNAWLLMDRDTQADDNAEHLYRYIQRNRPDINAWFVLRKTSHDWQRLKKEGFRLLAFGSEWHKLALLNARHLISSNVDYYITHYLTGYDYRDLVKWDFTFLQHGVTKDDLSGWLNGKPIRHFITTAPREYESICIGESGYKFTPREVALTGFPRHDRLQQRLKTDPEPKTVLIMPTWRESLIGERLGAGNDRAKVDDFHATQFYQAWSEFITSPELTRLTERYGFQVLFFPHANLAPYIEDFRNDNVQVIGHADVDSIQELFLRSSIMITDYSSAAFEMAYLERPVIYYQFDEASAFGGGHIYEKGYFDYRRDGFGPVCTDQKTLLSNLESILAADCWTPEPYAERMNEFFAYRDGRCCERVCNLIAGEQQYMQDAELATAESEGADAVA